jgi:hypothetical protein
VQEFIAKKEWCKLCIEESFCDQQKQKTLIASKHILILELIVLFHHLEFDMNQYSWMLMEDLKEAVQMNCNEKGLLIASMLITMFKMTKRVNIPWDPKRLHIFDTDSGNNCKNLQFMLEELVYLQTKEA